MKARKGKAATARKPSAGNKRTAKRVPLKSCFEQYSIPFMSAEPRSFWNVKPSGDYRKDCDTGRMLARAFLITCDGTIGWAALMAPIVRCMVEARDTSGLVVGFMSLIGEELCAAWQAVQRGEQQSADNEAGDVAVAAYRAVDDMEPPLADIKCLVRLLTNSFDDGVPPDQQEMEAQYFAAVEIGRRADVTGASREQALKLLGEARSMGGVA